MFLQIAAVIFRNKRAYSGINRFFSDRRLQQSPSHLWHFPFLLLQFAFVMLLLSFVRSISAQESVQHRLLFVSERDDNREIYAVNDDGTDLQNLTNNPADDAYPDWLPNGHLVTFQSNRDGNWEIYAINPDGSNPRNITNNPADDERPNLQANAFRSILSDDGLRVYFQSNRDGNDEIYWMDFSGLRIIRETDNDFDDQDPVVLAGGSAVVFRSYRSGSWLLHIIASTRSSGVNFELMPTVLGSDDHDFAWAPASVVTDRLLAFERNGDIYSVDVDHNDTPQIPPVNLTISSAYDQSPVWSPDGSRIAYVSDWDIYVMNADGSNPHNLTQNPAYDISPTWSPDGTQIAFASFRDEDWEIYAMNMDGCNVRRLTDARGWDGMPSWYRADVVSPVSLTERTPTAIVNTPNANLRDGPSENYAIIANAGQRECLSIIGRTSDGVWLQIQHGDLVLWVSASIVDIVGNVEQLRTIEP
jgi:Tol biopolymer transport system component